MGLSIGRWAILMPMPQQNRLNLPSAPVKRQTENRHLFNDARCPAEADFFTVGYTGRKIDDIFALLEANGVRTLVDIRKNAVSMYRPELSKTNLKRLTEERGLEYCHVPEWGV